jgi:hypothetical protein
LIQIQTNFKLSRIPKSAKTAVNKSVFYELLQIKVSFFRCRDLVIIKLQEDGIKKVGVQNKAGINLKIPQPMQAMPVKHLCTSRPAGREIDQSKYAQDVEENNKRYQENPVIPNTTRIEAKRNHENK